MIVIGKPYVEGRGQEAYLCSLIKDECRNSESVYWYSVENQYGEYLCDDYADAFLLMVLPVAIKTGQDIRLESPVSSQLLYNINQGKRMKNKKISTISTFVTELSTGGPISEFKKHVMNISGQDCV